MLASNYYLNCTASSPCYAGSTEFINGVVQNPVVGNAVITATTPLGIALQSAAGTVSSFGYNTGTKPQPADSGCTWPATLAYNTVTQVFDATGYPLVIDGNGHWSVATHWFYSSFLANNNPPDATEIAAQGKAQVVPAVLTSANSFNPKTTTPAPTICPNPTSTSNPANAEPNMTTSFPTSGATNCALYIAKDPASMQPNPSYKRTSGSQPASCWSPTNTPGYQYGALSCQNYAGHNFVFFWNDMSGNLGLSPPVDDTDYGNATLQVSCSGASYVMLIN